MPTSSEAGEFAVQLEKVGKAYRIGRSQGLDPRYRTLRSELAGAFKRLASRKSRMDQSERIWAVRDVSLRIRPAERVGIIGRNGAGKSTLLKLISRITIPTEGKVLTVGRVGTLLELGTGFHPELTGLDNVILAGAILGMSRKRIRERLADIAEFAGVEKFMNTPVKHFSTGMYMRLAFSVAVHLDADILLVDEALAVGDVDFQRKCVQRMEELALGGRTVVFVSHSMPTVARLCPRVVVMESGRVVYDGPSQEAISAYLGSPETSPLRRSWNDFDSAPGDEAIRLQSVEIEPTTEASTLDWARPVRVKVAFWARKHQGVRAPVLRLGFRNGEDILIFRAEKEIDLEDFGGGDPRLVRVACVVPPFTFAPGNVHVNVAIKRSADGEFSVAEPRVVTAYVSEPQGSAEDGAGSVVSGGVVRPKISWEAESG